MSDSARPKINPVPFVLADILFLGVAAYIVYASERPLETWRLVALLAAVAAGAWCSFIPFAKQFKADVQLAESEHLATTVGQIQNIEAVARHIQLATGHWQTAHEHASKTSAAAKEAAERMTVEIKSFSTFMEKADHGEKQHLRLEIEKLRRSEGEWLQVSVRILDHVFALYAAAVRSSQPALIEQLGQFQNACLEALRRVGLSAFAVRPEEPFNPEHHNLPPNAPETVPGTPIESTLALGVAFQGQILRKPLVSLKSQAKVDPAILPEPVPAAPPAPVESVPVSPEEPSPEGKKAQGEPPPPSNGVAPEEPEGAAENSRIHSESKRHAGSLVEQELF